MNKVFDSAKYDLAERLLREFLSGIDKCYVGDAKVYSAKEWAARGEPYGKNSFATLVVDGSTLYDVLNGHLDDPVMQQLDQVLEQYGLYSEMGFSWTLHVYEI